MQQTKPNRNNKRTGTRFPGIVGHAKALGVNRVTLYRVLIGEYRLPGLKARYDQLVASLE